MTNIEKLHAQIIKRNNEREQIKADSLRHRPGYDSIGQNQYTYTLPQGKPQGKGR